jgi:hypothetical protein
MRIPMLFAHMLYSKEIYSVVYGSTSGIYGITSGMATLYLNKEK